MTISCKIQLIPEEPTNESITIMSSVSWKLYYQDLGYMYKLLLHSTSRSLQYGN